MGSQIYIYIYIYIYVLSIYLTIICERIDAYCIQLILTFNENHVHYACFINSRSKTGYYRFRVDTSLRSVTATSSRTVCRRVSDRSTSLRTDVATPTRTSPTYHVSLCILGKSARYTDFAYRGHRNGLCRFRSETFFCSKNLSK